jgi:hypothetical protein
MPKPTDEQVAAVEAFGTGMGLAIEAGAGTGKTSTLIMCAESAPRGHGQYVAFNRAIVDDFGRRCPDNVRASTAHSLAMRAIGQRYRHRLGASRVRSDEIARQMGITQFVIRYGSESKVLQRGYLASLVMRGVRNFCQSTDKVPGVHHVPYIDGIDLPNETTHERSFDNNNAVRAHIAPFLGAAWADICDPGGRLKFEHDHYLKMFELNDPKMAADFVLFDEAQDAAPVMLSIVEQQVARGTQLVFVGDSQQQIYEWRGAVNALERVPADLRSYLTKSFRFGDEIATVANTLLRRLDSPFMLSGNPEVSSRLVERMPNPSAILTRTNAGAVTTVLRLQAAGRGVYLVGGGAEVASFARAATDLMERGWTAHPELACFRSWDEVIEYSRIDPQGDELRLMVSLVEEFGCEVILDALGRMDRRTSADVVVSTAHKAKGLEFPKVRLADDFAEDLMPSIGPDGRPKDLSSELRLLYVAVTRAKLELDVSNCGALRELLGMGKPEEEVAL